MARINWNRVGLHVLFWLVYILLNALLNFIYDRVEHFPEAVLGEFFSLPPKIVLVYFIFYEFILLYLD